MAALRRRSLTARAERAALWLALLALIPPPPAAVAAGLADAAAAALVPQLGSLDPPLRSLETEEYAPIVWTAEQVASMRRRALQLLAAGGNEGSPAAPVCELGLTYRVLETSSSNWTALLQLANNRELNLQHWQAVFSYADAVRRPFLSSVGGGAVPLSTGAAAPQAPVRLVDSFSTDGVPGGGGSTSFVVVTSFQGPASPDLGMSIFRVNLNGLQCFPTGSGGPVSYGSCGSARPSQLPLLAAPAPAPALVDLPGAVPTDACEISFCCGVVLVTDAPPPPQPSPPPPAPSSPALPDGPGNLTALGQPVADGSSLVPGPAVSAPGTAPAADGSAAGSRRGGALVPAVAGGAAGAAALLLGALLLLLALRRRRQLHAADAKQQPPDNSMGEQAPRPEAAAGSRSSMGDGGLALPSPLSLPMQAGASPALWAAGCQVTIAPTIQAAEVDGKADDAAAGASGGAPGCPASPCSGAATVDLSTLVLKEELGQGAFGVVYRAEWQGRDVAVKVLSTSNPREVFSFEQEIKILASLRHPRIVGLLGACTVPPNVVLVEELATGGSLHQLLHGTRAAPCRRPLPLARLLEIALDVAEAMCFLHPRIVHRDLKTQNILLDAEGRALVADFGIARHKDKTFLSTVGQAGTPSHMPPEAFDGRPTTEKVDVYGFAVVLVEMLTGEVPWQDLEGPMQIIYRVSVLGERPQLPPDSPPFLRQLIQDCWAEQPEERPSFETIRQLLQAELARVREDPEAAAFCIQRPVLAADGGPASACQTGSGWCCGGGQGGGGGSGVDRLPGAAEAPEQQAAAGMDSIVSPFAARALRSSSSSSEEGET